MNSYEIAPIVSSRSGGWFYFIALGGCQSSILRMTLHGLPAAKVPAGIDFVTTLPAPTHISTSLW